MQCRPAARVPNCVLFWRACATMPAALQRAKEDESAFLFDRLLRVEAYEPLSIFVATNGSRFKDKEGAVHVGRAYVLHDGHQLRTCQV